MPRAYQKFYLKDLGEFLALQILKCLEISVGYIQVVLPNLSDKAAGKLRVSSPWRDQIGEKCFNPPSRGIILPNCFKS